MAISIPRSTFAAAALALFVAACAESPSGPTASMRSRVAETGEQYWPQVDVKVCKVGTAADFDVSVDGGAPTRVSLLAGGCANVFSLAANLDERHLITVTEVSAAGVTLDSIIHKVIRYEEVTSTEKLTGVSGLTVEVVPTKGHEITFYNSEVPLIEGCTPGYWKQPHHFDSWVGYTPNTLFSSVFENAFPGKTLLEVLQTGGGGLDALGRHTVAALLNAANDEVFYGGMTTADVISAFNAAFPGSNSAYTTLKNRFEAANEAGCSIN